MSDGFLNDIGLRTRMKQRAYLESEQREIKARIADDEKKLAGSKNRLGDIENAIKESMRCRKLTSIVFNGLVATLSSYTDPRTGTPIDEIRFSTAHVIPEEVK